jgi:heavy metal translocating P-type ATPase
LAEAAWPWVYRALVLLVISCPCALVISTPVAVVCGLARAARTGILIKGGRVLEALGSLKALALDKTGTLTKGQPIVVEVRPVDGMDARELLRLTAAVEARSEHPLAAAILQAARERGIAWPQAADFRAVPGRGAQAQLDGVRYHVGSHRYIEELGLCNGNLEAILGELEGRGQTPVVLSNASRVLGVLGVADQIREGAAESLSALRRLGVRPLVILTGDTPRTAEAAGRQAGADEVRAQLLPEEKMQAIQALVERHGSVGMVGDGINDAPALARADAGLAIGTGADVAVSAAPVTLIGGDLRGVPRAIGLSRQTLRIIRQNLFWALFYNVVLIPAAAFGLLTPILAASAMALSSVFVVSNSLRLRKVRLA